MTPERLLLVFRARIWLILACLTALGGAAFAFSALSTRMYTAQTQLLLDVREPELLQSQGGNQGYGVLSPTYVATQGEIVHSARVATRVIKALGLDASERAIAQWKAAREANATLEQYYSEVLNRFLVVIPSRTSNVLTLEFTNPSPEFAATAANAFAKAYLEASVELKVDPTREYADWFAERASQERARLEQAQARLSDFQRENGIVTSDERVDMETARLAELSSQLTQVQGQLGESASRERQARKPGTSPDVLHNGVVESLRSDIARSEAKLEDLGKQYGQNHPAYQRAAAELGALRYSLEKEMSNVAGTVGASNDVNVQREAQIREALRAQKEKVLNIRARRDELALLQRDVDSAQKGYDLVTQRFSQTTLESKVQHTNIIVLSQAQAPTHASSPKVGRNTAIGLALGLLLGLALAFVLEQRRPRIRSEADVEQLLGLPLLDSLPSLRAARRGFGRAAAQA